MKCFSCKESELMPVRLEPGLPALECGSCSGAYIDLLTYREWIEGYADEESHGSVPVTSEVTTDESDHALICQRCQRIMLKFKISGVADNYVDLCSTCDDAWLDKGEWQLLKNLQLQGKLTEIVTRPWQKHIREERATTALENRYRDSLGDTDFEKAKEYADWLAEHPKQREIENFVRYVRRK